MFKTFTLLVATLALISCARTHATRTSQNTMMLDVAAAPVCGSMGATEVSEKAAAIETIRAGYDRYIITGSSAQNNVQTTQLPGQFRTVGSYGGGGYNSTTTYVPGATIVSGTHDKSLGVVMFRVGDPGYEQAIDARQALGPTWPDLVKNGIHTC